MCRSLGPDLCPPHVLEPCLLLRSVGQLLWTFSSWQFLSTVRRCLQLLGVTDAHTYTLKAFRAGRATELATQGESWAAVLAAGEWKSLSALNYIDAEAVDEAAASWEAVQASSEEDP